MGKKSSNKKVKKPKWRKFEQLAAQIYQELAPNATVVHNDHIWGVDSEGLRQIDVSIRYRIAGHDLLTIVQVKNYSRPADIKVVGEFTNVIKDVRANKGIIICRSGFSARAKKLAESNGIDVCNIHDAENRDWSLEISLPILWVDLTPVISILFQARLQAGDSVSRNPDEWILSNDSGKTKIDILGTFIRKWNDRVLSREIGVDHYLRDPTKKDVKVRVIDRDGQSAWRPIIDIGLKYTVNQQVWLGSFSPEQCRGILNYKDEHFETSYLPIGEIPTDRGKDWLEVKNINDLAADIPGRIITTQRWQINRDSMQVSKAKVRRLSS